jgi:hypothetical protein
MLPRRRIADHRRINSTKWLEIPSAWRQKAISFLGLVQVLEVERAGRDQPLHEILDGGQLQLGLSAHQPDDRLSQRGHGVPLPGDVGRADH